MVPSLHPILKRWRRLQPLPQWLLIALLSFNAIVVFQPIAVGQISFSAPATEAQSQTKPWWDLSKARRCGKLWCSEVPLRYNPYNRFFDELIIAAQPQPGQAQVQVIETLEARAETLEQTFYAILKQIVRFQKQTQTSTSNFSQRSGTKELSHNWQFWLITNHEKPLHPLDPKIEVGIKNQQTVIFVPDQPDLGVTSQTIVTVTEPDALHNGLPIPDLAAQWRDLLRQCMNEALWGKAFDYQFPWARPCLIVMLLVLTIMPTLALTGARNFLRDLDRNVRQQLHVIEQAARSETIAAYSSNVASVAEETPEAEDGEFRDTHGPIPTSATQPSDSPDINFSAEEPALENISTSPSPRRQFHVLNLARKAQQFIAWRIQVFLQTLPKLGLQQQNLLKQWHNLLQLLLRLLLIVRFLILMVGVVGMTLIYPATRLQAVFLMTQAFILPLVWISVSVADLLMSFVIDHYLHQWALDAQITDPQSTRYALRVSTYSPVLKGASTFVFISLGLYLTILVLGIDTSVLAGAGAAALVVGFLSRNLLEDMLNGILILWTDRYAIGDVISVANVGGFVENMNLYTTQLRGSEGRLITIPNGQVRMVENLTKDWSRVDFKVEIASSADATQAMAIIEQVATEMQGEPEWQDLILEPASILGVDQVSHAGTLIQVWIKTQPMKQWAVGREFRLRIKQAFEAEGIALGVPQREIWHRDRPNVENSVNRESL